MEKYNEYKKRYFGILQNMFYPDCLKLKLFQLLSREISRDISKRIDYESDIISSLQKIIHQSIDEYKEMIFIEGIDY